MTLSPLLIATRADFSSSSRRSQPWAFSYMSAVFASNPRLVESSFFSQASNGCCILPTFPVSAASNTTFNSNFSTLTFFLAYCHVLASHSLGFDFTSTERDRRSSMYYFMNTGISNSIAAARERVASSASSVIPSATLAFIHNKSSFKTTRHNQHLYRPSHAWFRNDHCPADDSHHNSAKPTLV